MDRIHDAVSFEAHVVGGTLTFKGTHVPVSHLFQFLSLETALRDFHAQYPQVSREQAVLVLEAARELLHARFEAPLGIHPPQRPVVSDDPKS